MGGGARPFAHRSGRRHGHDHSARRAARPGASDPPRDSKRPEDTGTGPAQARSQSGGATRAADARSASAAKGGGADGVRTEAATARQAANGLPARARAARPLARTGGGGAKAAGSAQHPNTAADEAARIRKKLAGAARAGPARAAPGKQRSTAAAKHTGTKATCAEARTVAGHAESRAASKPRPPRRL